MVTIKITKNPDQTLSLWEETRLGSVDLIGSWLQIYDLDNLKKWARVFFGIDITGLEVENA